MWQMFMSFLTRNDEVAYSLLLNILFTWNSISQFNHCIHCTLIVSPVKEGDAIPSSSCGEIGSWRTVVPTFNSIFQNSAQFNSTSGRFKAKEDGLYLVTGNILIRHSGSSEINMSVLLDGQSSKTAFKTFQPKPSNSPRSDFISTLTLVGTVRLIDEQYLSIFIEAQCQGSSSWKVLDNSSFSVVLVSRWESDYAAGFLANTTSFGNGQPPTFSKVHYWHAWMFSKDFEVTKFFPFEIKSSGLYFLQSVLILNDIDGNTTFHSGVCIDNEIAFNGIMASKVSEGLKGEFVISAFGVLYLRKGQKVYLCTRSENNADFENRQGSSFSMVRFLAPGQQPGLHLIMQHVHNTSVPCERSVISSVSTSGNQLTYVHSNVVNPNPTSPCDKGDLKATLTGTYFISLIFTVRGNVPENVTACAGPRKCAECYVEVSSTLRQYNNTFGFVGLVDLKKDELISICLKSQDETFSLETATRSLHVLSELQPNRTVQLKHRSVSFSSSGWHKLPQWKTSNGKSVQNIYVVESGLYVLSVNMKLKVADEGLVGLKLKSMGSPNIDVSSILTSAEAGSSVSLAFAFLARLNASDAIDVSVYSSSDSLNTSSNSTFFFALITRDNQHPCLSLRSKISKYSAGEWWQGIEPWEDVDAQCVSPRSDSKEGRFVADVAGVYIVAAVVMVRTTSPLQQTR